MEANRERAKVHRLPTEDKHTSAVMVGLCGIMRATQDEDVINDTNDWMKFGKPQHLYFTTDEEIKEGDSFINTNFQKIYQANSENSKSIIEFGPHPEIRKIIATTDPKLTKKKCTNCSGKGHIDRDGFRYCHCKTGEVYNIAQPSQALIKAYCEQGGFDEVDVEYDFKTLISEDVYNEIVTFLKVDPIHNTITTHRIVEKMYSLDEMKKMWIHLGEQGWGDSSDEGFDKWIKENLKQ